MIEVTLTEIASAIGGYLVGGADGAALVSAVSIDSRTVEGGELFFALVGEHADGHLFAAKALDRGALAAVVTRDIGGPAVLVEDTLAALGALARFVREELDDDVAVVAVTGSVGKTTTKDYIAAVLERRGATVAPPNSFNNEVGLPLTITQVDEETRNLVLEMGARGIGHIADLCSIGHPTIGVVLNIGSAHLGEFGTRETIAVAKRELIEHLESSGTAVLNADDALVAAMAAHTPARVVTFSATGRPADVQAQDVRLVGGKAHFSLHAGDGNVPVTLAELGLQQVPNAVAAATVGYALGMKLQIIGEALSAARSRSHWRMEVHERSDGVTIVNDAYNASPEAVRAALAALVELGSGGRRTWMVQGPMAELGEESERIHHEIGLSLGASAVTRVLIVGESARPMFEGVASANHRVEGVEAIEFVPDIETARAILESALRPGDVVLVKAARAQGFERLAAWLVEGAA